jgi:uncharacterized phage protein gp47/JayE
MPIRNGDYVQRTDEEVFETIVSELLNQEPDANPRAQSTLTYALIWSLAATIAQNQEQSLQDVYESAYVVDATQEELTKKARNLGVIRQDATKATGVVTFTRSSPATQDYTIPSGTTVETLAETPVQFETTNPVVIGGPEELVDANTYSTTNTTYTAKTTHTVDVTYRSSIDVQADIKNSNSSYTTSLEVVDTTNSATITTGTTTNTSYETTGPATYDVSSLTGDITVEFRVKTSDSSGTASLANAEADLPGQTGVDATIVAVDGGSSGNVGPNAIQAMPSKPTGVEEVTNDEPTGDPSLKDTAGDPLREGRNRESDQALRNRVLNTDAVREGPSASGLELALSETKGVISLHVNSNQTGSTVDGLDPYHSEVVVYGGDVYDVGSTLRETMSATTLLRLQGGVNGTKETTTQHVDLLDQDITIPITRPTLKSFSITIDVVHTSAYNGDIAVKDAIVRYVGGTYADDSTTTALGVGENVLVNEMENHVEDVQGVDYADITLVDVDGDGTDDTTTDSDGVPVLSVSNSEVSRVDADDITVNTTAR